MYDIKSPIMPRSDIFIAVKTGDKQGAGTDCKIWIVLHDDQGRISLPLRLHNRILHNSRNSSSNFQLQSKMVNLNKIIALEFWTEKFGLSTRWFVEYFKITNVANGKVFTFPVHRWINPSADHFIVEPNDASLPQQANALVKEQRLRELRAKRQEYRYKQHILDGPMQAAILPIDEKFSEEYYWSFAKEKASLLMKTKFIKWTTRKWNSLEELKSVTKKSLGEPACLLFWNTDEWFGCQRIQGLNPYIIRLCREIPQNFDVSEATVFGLLGELSLKEAMQQNKIFICDLSVIDGIPCKNEKKICAPLALFFLKNNELVPIAIQLHHKKNPENPVFTPKDPANTWIVAKMFYNNAEAQHHQGISHLGLTHLLMEGICVCTHRHLSPSHPIFKLLAPHFLFLIAINARGLEKLISPGGYVDCCMTQGLNGIFETIRRGLNNFHFYNNGYVPKEIESRGVLDKNILSYYPYRDDAVALFDLIKKYVIKVVRNHYDSEINIKSDWELQDWRIELTKKKENGGVGIIGVPGDDIKGFSTYEELIDTVTIIISACSLGHAASNFQQYDQYGFIPNYPGVLMKDAPTSKKDYSEAEILEMLPDMETTLSTMVITKLLSKRGTNCLGNFEIQYLYNSSDVEAADEFRSDLEQLSLEIRKRNESKVVKFPFLDPKTVPNSISI